MSHSLAALRRILPMALFVVLAVGSGIAVLSALDIADPAANEAAKTSIAKAG